MLYTVTELFDYQIVDYIENCLDQETRKKLLFSPIKQRWPSGIINGNIINSVLEKDLFLITHTILCKYLSSYFVRLDLTLMS